MNTFIKIIENIHDENTNSNSQFFGNIMIRFFLTKKEKCRGELTSLEIFTKMANFYRNTNPTYDQSACFSKNHNGDEIEKNVSVGRVFNYTDKFNITRSIESIIGSYDNTGVSIVFYKAK